MPTGSCAGSPATSTSLPPRSRSNRMCTVIPMKASSRSRTPARAFRKPSASRQRGTRSETRPCELLAALLEQHQRLSSPEELVATKVANRLDVQRLLQQLAVLVGDPGQRRDRRLEQVGKVTVF